MDSRIIENITNKADESKNLDEQFRKACNNKYYIFILDGCLEYFFVLAAFGNIIALFLKSYSILNLNRIF